MLKIRLEYEIFMAVVLIETGMTHIRVIELTVKSTVWHSIKIQITNLKKILFFWYKYLRIGISIVYKSQANHLVNMGKGQFCEISVKSCLYFSWISLKLSLFQLYQLIFMAVSIAIMKIVHNFNEL